MKEDALAAIKPVHLLFSVFALLLCLLITPGFGWEGSLGAAEEPTLVYRECADFDELKAQIKQGANVIRLLDDIVLDGSFECPNPVTVVMESYSFTVPKGRSAYISGPFQFIGSGIMFDVYGYMTLNEKVSLRVQGDEAIGIYLRDETDWINSFGCNLSLISVEGVRAVGIRTSGAKTLLLLNITAVGENSLCVDAAGDLKLVLSKLASNQAESIRAQGTITLESSQVTPRLETAVIVPGKISFRPVLHYGDNLFARIGRPFTPPDRYSVLFQSFYEEKTHDITLYIDGVRWEGIPDDLSVPGEYRIRCILPDLYLNNLDVEGMHDLYDTLCVIDAKQPLLQLAVDQKFYFPVGILLVLAEPLPDHDEMYIEYRVDRSELWTRIEDPNSIVHDMVGNMVITGLPRDHIYHIKVGIIVEGVTYESNIVDVKVGDIGGDTDGGDQGDQGELDPPPGQTDEELEPPDDEDENESSGGQMTAQPPVARPSQPLSPNPPTTPTIPRGEDKSEENSEAETTTEGETPSVGSPIEEETSGEAAVAVDDEARSGDEHKGTERIDKASPPAALKDEETEAAGTVEMTEKEDAPRGSIASVEVRVVQVESRAAADVEGEASDLGRVVLYEETIEPGATSPGDVVRYEETIEPKRLVPSSSEAAPEAALLTSETAVLLNAQHLRDMCAAQPLNLTFIFDDMRAVVPTAALDKLGLESFAIDLQRSSDEQVYIVFGSLSEQLPDLGGETFFIHLPLGSYSGEALPLLLDEGGESYAPQLQDRFLVYALNAAGTYRLQLPVPAPAPVPEQSSAATTPPSWLPLAALAGAAGLAAALLYGFRRFRA